MIHLTLTIAMAIGWIYWIWTIWDDEEYWENGWCGPICFMLILIVGWIYTMPYYVFTDYISLTCVPYKIDSVCCIEEDCIDSNMGSQCYCTDYGPCKKNVCQFNGKTYKTKDLIF